MLQISRNIKFIRKLWKATQDEFAHKYKVTVPMIKSYEGGKANPDPVFISRLARDAGVNEDDLMTKILAETDINWGEKVEKVLPIGNLKVTLEDYVNEIKRQRDYLEKLVVDKSDKIINLLTNSNKTGPTSRN